MKVPGGDNACPGGNNAGPRGDIVWPDLFEEQKTL